MARKLVAIVLLGMFSSGIIFACVVKQHVPPGQIKKQYAPGQQKKR